MKIHPSREDLTNQKFGFLTVIKMLPTKRSKCLCSCNCGDKKCEKEIVKMAQYLKKGCGACRAYNDKNRIKSISKHNDCINYKTTTLHTLWGNIKSRCLNKNSKIYKFYGARGIKMYKPWINNYALFKSWVLKNIGDRPTVMHSLDRINVNGNYTPGNLRWATREEQAQNMRASTKKEIVIDIYTKFHKDKKTVAELIKEYDMPRQTIYYIVTQRNWKSVTEKINLCS